MVTTSLGNLFQCLTTLSVKKFFLISNLNLPWHTWRHFSLSCQQWEGTNPALSVSTFQILEGSNKVFSQPLFPQNYFCHHGPCWRVCPLLSWCSPLDTDRLLSGHLTAFSSSGCTAPALSACSHRRGVPSLGSFLWLSSGCAPAGLCLFCVLLRTPHLDAVFQLRSQQCRGLFWCSLGYDWLSCLWRHIAGWCPACHPPVPLSSFCQDCAQFFHSPACVDHG